MTIIVQVCLNPISKINLFIRIIKDADNFSMNIIIELSINTCFYITITETKLCNNPKFYLKKAIFCAAE